MLAFRLATHFLYCLHGILHLLQPPIWRENRDGTVVSEDMGSVAGGVKGAALGEAAANVPCASPGHGAGLREPHGGQGALKSSEQFTRPRKQVVLVGIGCVSLVRMYRRCPTLVGTLESHSLSSSQRKSNQGPAAALLFCSMDEVRLLLVPRCVQARPLRCAVTACQSWRSSKSSARSFTSQRSPQCCCLPFNTSAS